MYANEPFTLTSLHRQYKICKVLIWTLAFYHAFYYCSSFFYVHLPIVYVRKYYNNQPNDRIFCHLAFLNMVNPASVYCSSTLVALEPLVQPGAQLSTFQIFYYFVLRVNSSNFKIRKEGRILTSLQVFTTTGLFIVHEEFWIQKNICGIFSKVGKVSK